MLDEITHSEGNEPEIDRMFDSLVGLLHETARVLPRYHFRKNLKPYWSDELNILKRDKMFWFKQWKEGGPTLDPGDPVRINMKASKKLFVRTLRNISKQYKEDRIAEAAKSAEFDRDSFWRIFKSMKNAGGGSVHAVQNAGGKVVYKLDEILEVWKGHFDTLSTSKHEDKFDNQHYEMVSQAVREWTLENGISDFLEIPFTNEEVKLATQKLNQGKTPGHDGITAEHIRLGGPKLVRVLCALFNLCVLREYVPGNFRKGIQVPLYKGNITCSLSPDNYRGITLLSTFNKLFEVLIWRKVWFWDCLVSDLHGAGRKCSSCIHTALTLQETIAKERERHRNIFVSYYDVSKAYDSVWVDGLFYQLHEMGINGSLWRILYTTHQDFMCCVRIGEGTSAWYPMQCGMHQGGFLSLVKYTAFINSLLTSLEESHLCSTIFRINTSQWGMPTIWRHAPPPKGEWMG